MKITETRCEVVYRLVFANGQQYVGSTVKRLNARMHSHRQNLWTSNAPLYICWREWGEPSVEIVAGPGLLEADLREREYREVGSLPLELRLNVAPGGMNGAFPGNRNSVGLRSADTKSRMSKARLGNKNRCGIPHSPEAKNRISAALTGQPKSERAKRRMREAWVRRRERETS